MSRHKNAISNRNSVPLELKFHKLFKNTHWTFSGVMDQLLFTILVIDKTMFKFPNLTREVSSPPLKIEFSRICSFVDNSVIYILLVGDKRDCK